MSQTISISPRLIAIIVILVVAIIAAVLVAIWLSDGGTARTQSLSTTFVTISHPAGTQVLFEDGCAAAKAGTDKLACQPAAYCALLGSRSSFDKVRDYYEREFAQRSWQETASGVFTIDADSQLALLEVPPETALMPAFKVPSDTLTSAWQTYSTTYQLSLYPTAEGCS